MNGLFDISTPEKRERFLMIVAAILFVVVVAPIFYHLFGNDVSKLRAQRNRLNEDIEKLEKDVFSKDQIKRRLDELTVRSLPPGDTLAQSLYQNWLIETAYATGLQGTRLDPGSITPVKNHYKKYTFTLHGRGSLEQISDFLRRFHKTDYLHLVRRVSPRSVKGSSLMDVSITIEALALPKARPSRTLRSVPEEILAITDKEKEILREITSRNLFAAYSPPREPGEPPKTVSPDEFDHSPYCYVTASLEGVDGKPEVWINIRTEGKLYKLHEGEMFRLGGVRCFVRKIEPDRVRFEAAGGFYTVRPGKSFVEYD